jgi:hypothetical protein
MAGGLVQVNVHADHEVQRVQRLCQARAVGAGQHRVGGHGEQGADLALAGSLDLFGQAGDGQLAIDLGRTADAGVVASGGHALSNAGFASGVGRKCGRFGKQRAAFAVQVAGQGVEHIHQPTAQRAVFLRAGANAGVNGGAGRTGQFTGEGANGVCADAATCATASGVKGPPPVAPRQRR